MNSETYVYEESNGLFYKRKISDKNSDPLMADPWGRLFLETHQTFTKEDN